MELYVKLFEVLSPVFFIVGIGYFLGKQKSEIDTTFITNYSANFGAPALFIFAITSSGVTYSIFSEYFIGESISIFVQLHSFSLSTLVPLPIVLYVPELQSDLQWLSFVSIHLILSFIY